MTTNSSLNSPNHGTLTGRSEKLIEELGDNVELREVIPESYSFVADARWLENQRFSWGVSQEVDELAQAIAQADANGFVAHDDGDFQAAEAHFFVRDANMFTSRVLNGDVRLKDLHTAAQAYSNTLRAKDCVEYANLSEEAKDKVAKRTEPGLENLEPEIIDNYAQMNSTEIFEKLTDQEKHILGVREVNSRDFMPEAEDADKNGWESLKNDEEGFALLEEFSKIRANALDMEEDYYTEGWFIPHKTVSPFVRICKMSRCAELAAATGIEEFNESAKVYGSEDPIEMVTHNPKPSDGLYEASIAAQKYVEAVQAHDFKTPFGAVRMTSAAAPYYKVSLMDHFGDSVEQARQAMEDSIYTYNEGKDIWHKYMREYAIDSAVDQ